MPPNRPPVIMLEHGQPEIASKIHTLLHAAYRVEAQLLDMVDFPPLARTREQVRQSPEIFYGCRRANEVLAVAEVQVNEYLREADISSFVVAPTVFRQGFGYHLLRGLDTLLAEKIQTITVATGCGNTPAIGLYQKSGFRPHQYWQHACGLDMVTLIRKRDVKR